MIVTALIAAAALAPAYEGRTDEGRRIVIAVSGRRVRVVRATIADYDCGRFGQLGPKRVTARVAAPVDRRGRFSFVAGERAERVGVAGTLRPNGVATGRIRVSGTIATGERCNSLVIRFRAPAR